MGKGEVDGIVLNTAGVAFTDRVVTDAGLRAGDLLIVTGTVGDHGMAIMSRRHDLRLEGDLRSDVAPLNGLVRAALRAGGDDVVAMKDPTRGGVAGVLHEMAGEGRRSASSSTRRRCRCATRCAPPARWSASTRSSSRTRARRSSAVRAARGREGARGAARPPARAATRRSSRTAIAERPGSVILDTGFGKRMLAEPEGELLPASAEEAGAPMHEYSLVEALVGRVEQEARRRSALAVHRLSVRIGELSGVDPELFRTAYETFRAGTICAEAPLALTRVAGELVLPDAAAGRSPRGEVLRCPACDVPARLDDGGDALTLDGIELEVP